jgi:phosphoribosyl-AMP cyclohydrolase
MIRFDDNGLIPAIVQDADTGQVLTLAYMNREALALTLTSGQTHFWSRSRRQLWHKGATSGNYQQVVDVSLDCDGDAVLVRVRPSGPACHTGAVSCFHRPLTALPAEEALPSAGSPGLSSARQP